MAGLANIFPGNYYNSDEAKALDFMGYFAHQRQQDEALKNNAINRDIALEDLFHTQQMNPLRREQQVLANRTSSAQLPGIEASSKQKVMSTEDYEKTRDAQVKAALAKLAKESSADELKQEQAQIEKMLLNPHISEAARSKLNFLRDQFTEIYKLQEKNTSAEDRARIAAEASVRRSATTAGGKSTAPKPPKTLAELEASLRAQAINNPEQASALLAQADAVKAEIQQRIQDTANARKAGDVDVGAQGIPVRPGITTAPSPAAATRPARQEAAKASLADVQKMYPGVPADKLKEAYKRKFGVDLK